MCPNFRTDIVYFIFTRGYTGHEHLDEFGIINMNSRMYDPLIAQFLSVDYLATDYPDYTPYAYAMNNPLKYTDPTGNAVLPEVTVRPTYDYGTASAQEAFTNMANLNFYKTPPQPKVQIPYKSGYVTNLANSKKVYNGDNKKRDSKERGQQSAGWGQVACGMKAVAGRLLKQKPLIHIEPMP